MPITSPLGSSALTAFVALPLAVVAGGWVVCREIGNGGDAFFDRGKYVVIALEQFARAAKSLDRQRLTESFAPDYQGESLGLGSLNLIDSRNGVERFTMRSRLAHRLIGVGGVEDPSDVDGKRAACERRERLGLVEHALGDVALEAQPLPVAGAERPARQSEARQQ